MLTILFERNPHPDAVARAAGFDLRAPVPEIGAPDYDLRGAHGIILSNVPQVDRHFLARAPDLRVVGRPGIGVDNVNLADCTAAGVLVVNTPDAPTESTAEHAAALILAVSRKLKLANYRLSHEGWTRREELQGIELLGKTLGLVGLGRIGGRLAQIMRLGFGMRVVAYDPYASLERVEALGAELAPTLADVLRQADVVSIHCPLSPQTRHLIDAAGLAQMKRGALLVNCARGPVVDEAALLDALREGRLGGAGLDVFDPEPPQPDNPLLALPNVMVTPHIASATDDGLRAMDVNVMEEVVTVLRGERPRWLVNPEVWERRRGR